jgi:ubiquinone/menaquinone biosynthesis C-methylase UbiE
MRKLQLPIPCKTRRNIPFFYPKTEVEFQQDKYENYEQTVTRQTRLHLSQQTWENYSYQPILDWIMTEINSEKPTSILDIGCSVGRLIGELAMRFPSAECWGIDFSYQLLRQAYDYWIAAKTIDLLDGHRGFKPEKITGRHVANLQFGLAKGERLPFDNQSLDLVVSSFTFDRFDEPKMALKELFRILKKDGKVLIITPLNFNSKANWDDFFPIEKLKAVVENIGFKINHFDENLVIQEALDQRGNIIHWKCMAMSLENAK